MFPSIPQQIRLVVDLDGYLRVYDTADWRVVFQNVLDDSGQPLSLNGGTLALQIRPVSLPNCVVDTLSMTSGITVTASDDPNQGPTIALTSLAQSRVWRAREETVLVGDLMLRYGTTTIFLTRLFFIVSPGVTRP